MISIAIIIALYFRGLGNYRFVFMNKIFIEFLTRDYI
jgi:hypothetical protein